MIKGIQVVASALKPMMLQMEVVANNLANLNTPGFKKDGVFMRMMKETALEQAKGKGDMAGYDSRRYTDFEEGSLEETGNALDLAIQGRGFFTVQTPQGPGLTRNGNFKLSVDGTVITPEGYPVLGDEGVLQLPDLDEASQGAIAITEEGEVMLDKKTIGRIRITDVPDQARLRKEGTSLFLPEKGMPLVVVAAGSMIVRQGYLEESNVEGLSEMILMVEMTRNFESGQKIIQYQDATLDRANDVGRW
jgi:flagellar basal-body rod protein FlgF